MFPGFDKNKIPYEYEKLHMPWLKIIVNLNTLTGRPCCGPRDQPRPQIRGPHPHGDRAAGPGRRVDLTS